MPIIPRNLTRAYREAGSYHKLAEALGVNVGHVYKFLKHGIEPKSPDIRERMYLPRKTRQPRGPNKPKTPIQRAINRMAKATRKAINANMRHKP